MPRPDIMARLENPPVRSPISREESKAKTREKVMEYEAATALVDQEFAQGRNRDLALTAAFIGGPMDLVQMGADALSGALVARSPELPYTSKYFKEKWGVEDDLLAEIVGGVLSPEPSSTGRALILPLAKIKKGSKALRSMYDDATEMFRNNASDVEVFRKTNVIKHPNGQLMYYRRDPGQINVTNLKQSIDDKFAGKLDFGKSGFIEVDLPTILQDDPQLLEMYPFLNDATIRVHVINRGTKEKPRWQYFNREKAMVGTSGQADPYTGTVDLFNPVDPQSWQDDMVSTLYHEIGHLIDAAEGLVPGGGSSGYLKNVQQQYNMSKMMEELWDDVDEAGPIEDWLNATPEEAQFLKSLFNKYNIDVQKEGVLESMERGYHRYAGSDEVNREAARLVLGDTLDRVSQRLAISIQESGIPFEGVVEEISPELLEKMSLERYFKLEGEFRQRLNQHLRTVDETRAKKILERWTATGEAPSGMSEPVKRADLVVDRPTRVNTDMWREGADVDIDFSTGMDQASRLRLVPEGMEPEDLQFIQGLVDRDPRLLEKLRQLVDEEKLDALLRTE